MIIISKILGSVKKWICPHCDNIQPLPKLEFIRHMTMWHEDVLVKEFEDEVARVQEKDLEATEKLAKGKKKLKELKEIEMELELQLAKLQLKVEENQSEAYKIQTEEDGIEVGSSGNPNSKPRVRGICDSPGCSVQSVHRCSRCLRVAYCSLQCQEGHWPEHQESCTHRRRHKQRRQQSETEVD